MILYGRSLILGTVGVGLQRRSHLEVVSLSPPLPTAQELCALRPQVVIVDLGAVPPEFPFSLLREQPDLLVIGMDAAGDKLLVLSGQQARSMTIDDLLQVIEGPADGLRQDNREVTGHVRLLPRKKRRPRPSSSKGAKPSKPNK